MSPLVSIVIPIYNSMEYLKKGFIDTVVRTNYSNLEIILVDDCSTDESLSCIKQRYGSNKKVKIISHKRNMGLGFTKNSGIKNGKGDYFVILDHDMEVDKDWILRGVEFLSKNTDVGLAQGKVRDLETKKRLNHAGIFYGPRFGWVECRGFGELDRGQYGNYTYCLAGGNGVLIRKDVFEKIGLFDKEIKFNVDDIDFALRSWICGYKTVFVPEIMTYHPNDKLQSERNKVIRRVKWEFEYAKMMRVFLKNYSILSLVLYFPQLILMQVIKSLYSLFKRGEWQVPVAMVMAFGWNIIMLSNTLSERKKIQRLRKIRDGEFMDKISIGKATLFKAVL